MRQRGFTLIELLVALVIFALLSAMAYRGLNSVIEARDHVAAEQRKWRSLSLFFARLEEDVDQASHRPITDKFGLLQPAWVGKRGILAEDDANLYLTRIGSRDMESTRIGYRFNHGTIEELVWPSLDQAPQARPAVHTLLTGVRELKLQYLSRNKLWVPNWPLAGGDELPRALEATLVLDSGEQIKRIFALP